MTEQEFERLRRRFGADVSAWPAPHRQEGLAQLAGKDEASDKDEALDVLILNASATDADEAALTRKVLARIAEERGPGLLAGGLWRMGTMPAAASGFAALLLLAAVGGFIAAGDAPERLEDALLALALGDSGLGDGGGLFDVLSGEGRL